MHLTPTPLLGGEGLMHLTPTPLLGGEGLMHHTPTPLLGGEGLMHPTPTPLLGGEGRMSAGASLPLEITLVEADDRLGGKLGTERTDGFLVDIGPDSFMAQKPWAVELCREIGLGDEI